MSDSAYIKASRIATENGHKMLGWTLSVFQAKGRNALSINTCRRCGATAFAREGPPTMRPYFGEAIDRMCSAPKEE